MGYSFPRTRAELTEVNTLKEGAEASPGTFAPVLLFCCAELIVKLITAGETPVEGWRTGGLIVLGVYVPTVRTWLSFWVR